MYFIKAAIETARMDYQHRYIKWCDELDRNIKTYGENSPQAEYIRGHANEASFTLISIFGLTDKEIREIEKNRGYTNADLELNMPKIYSTKPKDLVEEY